MSRDDEDPALREVGRETAQQQERAFISPVDVVEVDQKSAVLGGEAQAGRDRLEEQMARGPALVARKGPDIRPDFAQLRQQLGERWRSPAEGGAKWGGLVRGDDATQDAHPRPIGRSTAGLQAPACVHWNVLRRARAQNSCAVRMPP